MVMTRTDSSLSPTITATNFENSLHTAMLDAGFTLWYSYTASGQNRRIYREVFNSSTYGTAFYEIRINTTTRDFSVAAYVSFNTTTNTGTGAITGTTFTPTTGDAINYTALNGGSEFRLVLIRQAGTLAVVGQIRPSLNKPSWWNEDNYPYVWYIMYLTSNQWNNLQTVGGASLSPWNYNTSSVIVPRAIRGTVPGGQREISNAVELGSTASFPPAGTCGVFSNDIAQSSTEGLVPGVDVLVVTPGTEEYLVIQAASGGLVVRTV